MTTTPEANDLSHLSDDEFLALCPQGEHAPGPEPLSPAARAVLDAMRKELDYAPCPHFYAAILAIATELEGQ